MKISWRENIKYFSKQYAMALPFVVSFALIGAVLLVVSKASTPALSVEPETAVLSGASAVSDASASGGSALKFNAATGGSDIVRGFIENSDGAHDALFASMGFNTAVAPANTSGLDNAASHGLKAMVWVGDYDNAICQFQQSDAQITSTVSSIKNHAALVGYYITDEPEQASSSCTNMYTQLANRIALIHSIDTNPNHYTFQVVSNQGTNLKCYDYEPFMGTSDAIALDIYPFRHDASYVPCVSDPTHPLVDISQAIAAWNTQKADYLSKHPGATAPRLFAMLQDFDDTIWRRPTVAELQQQWSAWQGSGIEGIWYFSWDWQGNSLDSFTDHQCQYKIENNVATSC